MSPLCLSVIISDAPQSLLMLSLVTDLERKIKEHENNNDMKEDICTRLEKSGVILIRGSTVLVYYVLYGDLKIIIQYVFNECLVCVICCGNHNIHNPYFKKSKYMLYFKK